MKYQYLDKIFSPKDLRELPASEMPRLAEEIRDFLVSSVTRSGGHLASNLGVVELSMALHRVFDTPSDRIVWDVGHQSYVHKLLTGRRERFDTLRAPGGLSGFTKRSESEFDPFGAGHSSTSVSAAIGLSRADALQGSPSYTVAVMGDGAFTGGMVHEALNNIQSDLRLIIVLNENEMSISRNIGAFARYMARIRSSRSYHRVKRNTASILKRIPLIGAPLFRLVRWVKKSFKNLLYHSNYFEELGLFYLGPIDGNDYQLVERALTVAKQKGEPVVVHVRTRKGKGYAPAEQDPSSYHSIYPDKTGAETFSSVFGQELASMADADPKIVAVTAAMGVGTGLEAFSERHKDRYFDVGIAEQHAVTFSAGLAAGGMKPYAAIYSTFLQRAYDSILHDIALQGLPVRLMIDRAGLAPSDGATHHGIFDVAFLSHIPGIEIFAPATLSSLRAVMRETAESPSPLAIRYPSGGEAEELRATFFQAPPVAPWVRSVGDTAPDAVIVTYGQIAREALSARRELAEKGIRARVLLLEQLSPYACVAERLKGLLPQNRPVIFLEEAIKEGGAGMLLASKLTELGVISPLKTAVLAISESFADPSETKELYRFAGIDSASVVRAVEQFTARER